MNEEENKGPRGKKPFIGIHFKCCNIYSRIYLNAKGDAFVGWCPKCTKKDNLDYNGKYHTISGRYKAYKCDNCGANIRSIYQDFKRGERKKSLYRSVAR